MLINDHQHNPDLGFEDINPIIVKLFRNMTDNCTKLNFNSNFLEANCDLMNRRFAEQGPKHFASFPVQ